MHFKLIIENGDQKILTDTKWGVYTSPPYIKGEKKYEAISLNGLWSLNLTHSIKNFFVTIQYS